MHSDQAWVAAHRGALRVTLQPRAGAAESIACSCRRLT
nr:MULTISPECIES: hypothetical protein [unclassified Mycobacterium]